VKGPTVIGLVLLVAGIAVWLITPRNVTWGNHHYLKHIASYGLMGVGALFLLVGSRRG
jgi:hypothetical protein